MPRTWASKRSSALARMRSNTGWGSAIERLMTCSTSAVAVCRSSASRVSLNSRTFSMAITAWSRNDCASAISLSLKALAVERPSTSTPTQASPRNIGRYSDEFEPQLLVPHLLVGGKLDRRPVAQVQHGLADDRARRRSWPPGPPASPSTPVPASGRPGWPSPSASRCRRLRSARRRCRSPAARLRWRRSHRTPAARRSASC